MKKKIQNLLFAVIAVAVLCVGTVSARQLRSERPGSFTCGGTCSATKPCFPLMPIASVPLLHRPPHFVRRSPAGVAPSREIATGQGPYEAYD